MKKIQINKIIMRFVGDSGDGIQLIGNQIADSSVIVSGNDVYTFVDFPAEIRAPAGSISGVSGFQVSISSKKLYAVEDEVDLLVALNPAALKTSLPFLKKNGILILDLDSFTDKNLKKAGFLKNPIFDGSLDFFRLIKIHITKLTYECIKDLIPSVGKAKKCKNFFTLGLVCWLYDRDLDNIILWLKRKFKSSNLFLANEKVLKAGFNYGCNLELLQTQICIPRINLNKNIDSNVIKISGNKAFSIGAVTASMLMDMPLFSANYPITPASDVLHELAHFACDKIKVIQLEDEIAAINAVVGASYGGSLAFTCTSGPGLDLMQEGLGLAVMSELPALLLDIQRSGPSTGIPTKSEQTDLLASIFGRHGECDVVVLAPNSPSDCFWIMIEGFILSILYSTPVIILSDANLANSSELWSIPDIDEIKNNFDFKFFTDRETKLDYNNSIKSKVGRKNIIPGKSNHQYCMGGLERDLETGNVSQDAENHFSMVQMRYNKILSVADKFSQLNVIGNVKNSILIVTWGSTYGMVRSVYDDLISDGYSNVISLLCLRYLNPFPNNLNSIFSSFKKILLVEENLGQLAFLLRSKFLVDIISINQVTGKPFKFDILKSKIINNI